MVASLVGKWKVLFSLCHHSSRAVNNQWFARIWGMCVNHTQYGSPLIISQTLQDMQPHHFVGFDMKSRKKNLQTTRSNKHRNININSRTSLIMQNNTCTWKIQLESSKKGCTILFTISRQYFLLIKYWVILLVVLGRYFLLGCISHHVGQHLGISGAINFVKLCDIFGLTKISCEIS